MSTAAATELAITARLPEEDVRKLEELAKRADRSRSAELRRAVRVYLDVNESRDSETSEAAA